MSSMWWGTLVYKDMIKLYQTITQQAYSYIRYYKSSIQNIYTFKGKILQILVQKECLKNGMQQDILSIRCIFTVVHYFKYINA